jgi:hypothetical protein
MGHTLKITLPNCKGHKKSFTTLTIDMDNILRIGLTPKGNTVSKGLED